MKNVQKIGGKLMQSKNIGFPLDWLRLQILPKMWAAADIVFLEIFNRNMREML